MGYVPTSPRRRATYDADQRRTHAELDLLHRKLVHPKPKDPLVRLDPEEAEWWPNGTAWLSEQIPTEP